MSTWSRSQSQSMGAMRAISSGAKVKALGNLQPVAYKIKVANVREAKRLDRLAREASGELEVVKVREYLAPVKAGFRPTGFGRGRRSKHKLVGISDANFEAINNKRTQNRAFHAELRASLGV